jgi:hypothetical protein
MKLTAIARTASATLLLWAVFGPARAQQSYEPSAAAAAAAAPVLIPFLEEERERQAAARALALAQRRQEMIDECQQNHGSEIDCERETDTELRAEGLPWRTRIGASPAR